MSPHFSLQLYSLEINDLVHTKGISSNQFLHTIPPSLFPSSVIMSSSLSKAFSKATIFWIAPLLLVNACSSKTPLWRKQIMLSGVQLQDIFQITLQFTDKERDEQFASLKVILKGQSLD